MAGLFIFHILGCLIPEVNPGGTVGPRVHRRFSLLMVCDSCTHDLQLWVCIASLYAKQKKSNQLYKSAPASSVLQHHPVLVSTALMHCLFAVCPASYPPAQGKYLQKQ